MHNPWTAASVSGPSRLDFSLQPVGLKHSLKRFKRFVRGPAIAIHAWRRNIHQCSRYWRPWFSSSTDRSLCLHAMGIFPLIDSSSPLLGRGADAVLPCGLTKAAHGQRGRSKEPPLYRRASGVLLFLLALSIIIHDLRGRLFSNCNGKRRYFTFLGVVECCRLISLLPCICVKHG